MSYSTTAHLFFGVPLTDQQAETCESNVCDFEREGLKIVYLGDACTCRPWRVFLAVVVAEDEWWEEIGPAFPKLTRAQRKALTKWRKLCKIKEKPRWYLGNHGG